MPEEKKDGFVVSDRRKFTQEGELRPEAQQEEERSGEAKQENAATKPGPGPVAVETKPQQPTEAPEIPEPPSAAEQQAQHKDYESAGKTVDSMLEAAGAKRQSAEMNFEGLIASLYMTAMMQLGMIREEGAPMRPDIVGARNTIDTLALLNEKTKGNLTEREANMLQNVLFELRMAFIEITKAISRPPEPGSPGAAPSGAKK
jgi:hypothetical protein